LGTLGSFLFNFPGAKRVPTFAAVDSEYRRAIEAPGINLLSAFEAARTVANVDLANDEISKAVLMRLKSFTITQDLIKTHLDKAFAAPASDFFVETIVFYLKVVLDRLARDLRVESEKSITTPPRGSMRPDISIWRQEQLVAIVECKTQLGWNRDGWLHDFKERESRLMRAFPGAKAFLLVMTGSNWPGFGNDSRVGNQFFVLLRDSSPRDYLETATGQIDHRIETLISSLMDHANPNPSV
jgi:hypothetical protein